MSKKFLVDIDLNGNELQNAVIQNLASAPENPKEGQHYFNTVDEVEYYWNGTQWINVAGDYTFKNGIEQVSGTRDVQIKVATGNAAGNIAITANTDGLAATVADASTTTKGIIEIATDQEAATGTSEILAVNPKQLATKVDKLTSGPTAGTYTKVTVNSEGQVTAGTTITLSDVTDITATAAEVNVLDGITANTSELNILDGATLTTTELNYVDGVTSSIQDQLDSKVVKNADITASTTGKTIITYDAKGLVTGGSEIGIDSNSTNYLEFDTINHNIKAKVDTTVTDQSTKLVTSGAVYTAITNALVGGVIYQGTWDITSATDFSGITLPVKKGYLYYVVGTGPKTIDGIEWNAGDYLLVNDDVAVGGSLNGKVEKIDNSEAADIVRLNATQTLTNKTIDADDNTILDLTTSNLKSGVLQTSVRNSSTATDTSLASEKAVRTELDTKQDKVTTAVENNVATWNASGNTKDSGKAFVTSIGPSSGAGAATDNQIPTALATRSAVDIAISNSKITVTCPALTASSGVATWSITGLASDPYAITILDSLNNEVVADITYGTKAATIVFNATSNIAAGSFIAKILM